MFFFLLLVSCFLRCSLSSTHSVYLLFSRTLTSERKNLLLLRPNVPPFFFFFSFVLSFIHSHFTFVHSFRRFISHCIWWWRRLHLLSGKGMTEQVLLHLSCVLSCGHPCNIISRALFTTSSTLHHLLVLLLFWTSSLGSCLVLVLSKWLVFRSSQESVDHGVLFQKISYSDSLAFFFVVFRSQ